MKSTLRIPVSAWRGTGRFRVWCAALLIAVSVVTVPHAPADAYSVPCPDAPIMWVGGDGSFDDPTKWSTSTVPTDSDNVCVPESVEVTVSGVAAVNEIVVNGDLVVAAGGDLTINGPSFLRSGASHGSISVTSGETYADIGLIGAGATFSADSGAVLLISGTSTGTALTTDLPGGVVTFTGQGEVRLLNSVFVASAPVTLASPEGTLWVAGPSYDYPWPRLHGGTHGIELTGIVNWEPNGSTSGVVTNSGHLNLLGRAGPDAYGALEGQFTNDGTISWQATASWGIEAGLVFTNNGTIDVTGGIRLYGFSGAASFVNNGVINVADSARIDTVGFDWVNANRIVTGEESVFYLYSGAGGNGIDGDLTNLGTIILGERPDNLPFSLGDSLTVAGDFVHAAGAELVLAVSSSEASKLYATVDVLGSAVLDGAMVIDRLDGYDPPVGESYPMLGYASVTGDFVSESGVGPFFDAIVGATETTITRVAPDPSEGVSGVAEAGGVVETDQDVSVSNPLATSVQTPTGGLVSIVEVSPVPSPPPNGYEVLGSEFASISAPDATVADPLLIRFTLDWLVWSPYAPQDVALLRNGVLVPDCDVPGPSGAAAPDPCVGARSGVAGGDLTIDVRTSMASDWVLVAEVPTNVAPTLVVGVPGPVNAADDAVLTATITDSDLGDSHTCDVDWGDGESDTVSATGSECVVSHSYGSAGVYTASVMVTDEASASATASVTVIVYDPNAGFVTGGGWFTSPSGAYVPDSAVTGKAHVNVNVKYKKKAANPSGDTRFRLDAAGLDFRATTEDWLVVDGTSAVYAGVGKVNGVTGYDYMVWIDGSLDTFRIRIWTDSAGTETVFYDNATPIRLGGGNLTVHKGKG